MPLAAQFEPRVPPLFLELSFEKIMAEHATKERAAVLSPPPYTCVSG